MISLIVERRFRAPEYTIGSLSIDGEYLCDTLEDTDRGLRKTDPLSLLKAAKVPGRTAIPTGTYPLILTVSPRFKRVLPRLTGVPAFEGILIHAGNTHRDTSGCILVGENRRKGEVLNSRHWERVLLGRLEGAGEIRITIR